MYLLWCALALGSPGSGPALEQGLLPSSGLHSLQSPPPSAQHKLAHQLNSGTWVSPSCILRLCRRYAKASTLAPIMTQAPNWLWTLWEGPRLARSAFRIPDINGSRDLGQGCGCGQVGCARHSVIAQVGVVCVWAAMPAVIHLLEALKHEPCRAHECGVLIADLHQAVAAVRLQHRRWAQDHNHWTCPAWGSRLCWSCMTFQAYGQHVPLCVVSASIAYASPDPQSPASVWASAERQGWPPPWMLPAPSARMHINFVHMRMGASGQLSANQPLQYVSDGYWLPPWAMHWPLSSSERSWLQSGTAIALISCTDLEVVVLSAAVTEDMPNMPGLQRKRQHYCPSHAHGSM